MCLGSTETYYSIVKGFAVEGINAYSLQLFSQVHSILCICKFNGYSVLQGIENEITNWVWLLTA